jgi:hypothetical protein
VRGLGTAVRAGALVAWAAGLAACSSSTERYVVEVLGSREALEQYTVRADGLRDEGVSVARDQHLRRLSVEGEGALSRPALTLRSLSQGQPVDELSLEPFVCGQRPEKLSQLRKDGWALTERHQVLLTGEGRLARHTDLDRVLSYACEAVSGGDGGEGWSTPLGTAGACSEPERAATRVVLESGGETRAADLCHATYLQSHGGAVHLGFSFVEPGSALPLSVSLWHCMDPPTASYPVTLTAGEGFPRADCPRQPGASGLVAGAPASAPLLRGTWRLERIEFVDGGHLVGEVDVVFGSPGGSGELRLRGPVDLPVLRIPFNGGVSP